MSQSHTIDGISTLHRGERTMAIVLGNRMITIQADLNRPGYLKVEEQTLFGVSPDGRTIAGPVTLSPAVPLCLARTLTGLREDLEAAEGEAELATDAKWVASEALRKAPTPENQVAFERAEHAWEVASEVYRRAMREWSNACQTEGTP